MSKELHYYNKYKCPVCGCEYIVITHTIALYDDFYCKDIENLCFEMLTIKCTNPDCKTKSEAPSKNFSDSKIHKLWLKEDEPKPEKIQYHYAALKEALKILRPCTEIEVKTIYAGDPFGGLTPKPYLTVKRGYTIRHGFCRSDIDVLEAAFEILDKEEQK